MGNHQRDRMKKNLAWYSIVCANIIGLLFAGTAVAEEVEIRVEDEKLTPLGQNFFIQPTANHLQQGDFMINVDTRIFFLPDLVESSVDDEDTAVNFNTGFSWGITDKLQMTLQFQHVDSSSPARQGNFTSERTEDNEAAGEFKYQLWRNTNNTQALSGVVSASWGTRGFRFIGEGRDVEINNRNVFVTLATPFTAQVNQRWQFNFAPSLTFFNDKNAAFFHRTPSENDEEFGTVFGLSGGVSYQINPRFYVWGDAFVPLTGNNSISRESGQPDTAIAYNAGLRYLVNPGLALDFYASNTFASFGPLSVTADRDLVAFGTNLTFMPDLIAANRKYKDSFGKERIDTPLTTDGLAFFDGGILPSQEFLLQVQGGSQGILSALRYGMLNDFEVGIYLDYISDDIDESEQGISAKVRFLNQYEGSPITLSLATTVGLTNQPFINFLANDRNEFERQDLEKEVPIFTPGGDELEEGKQLIATIALPLHYQFQNNHAVWLTPIVGYVQREGTEIAGFNLGGAIALSEEFSVPGEVGANFAGEGNAFKGSSLDDEIPWTVAVRWNPGKVLKVTTDSQLELYLTNRVGSSTWHQLRVRDDNDIAIGLGLQFPF